MSLDRSLKSKASLTRHRNVLNRAERLKRLTDEERWKDERSIFGLPKVANRKMNVGKKPKAEKAEGEAAAAGAPGAAPVAAATAAAPAAGAKGAKPAAKPAAKADKKK